MLSPPRIPANVQLLKVKNTEGSRKNLQISKFKNTEGSRKNLQISKLKVAKSAFPTE